MTFAAPWGLLALLALPVIVALHMFRDRLREHRVSALFLFPVQALQVDGGRRRTRLLRSPSLWLECLAAVLFALWLAGLGLHATEPRHLVVVVDRSASMAADGTRRAAERALGQLAASLADGDEVTVIGSGELPEILVGPEAERDALSAPADARPGLLDAGLPAHDLLPAIDLGRIWAGPSGEVVLLTDREPAAACDDVRVLACGVPAPNAALGAVRVVPAAAGGRDRLHVHVHTFGAAWSGAVRVAAGGEELASVPFAVAQDERGDLVLSLPVRDALTVELRSDLGPDALSIDDTAELRRRPTPVVAVCNQLPADLREDLRIARVFEVLEHWRPTADPERAQLLLLSPAQVPGTALRDGQLQVVLGPTAGEGAGHRGPFVVDRSHELLRGVDLQGVAWRSGGGAVPGAVLVADGADVLVGERRTAQGRRLHVDVDPSAGNLMRAPDWPILFANVLAAARELVPGLRRASLRTGERLVFVADAATPVELLGPDGRVVAASQDGRLEHVVAGPGVYRVRDAASASGDDALAVAVVRHLDLGESDLRQAAGFERRPRVPIAERAAGRADDEASPLDRLLAAMLLFAVLGDWWVLSRRSA